MKFFRLQAFYSKQIHLLQLSCKSTHESIKVNEFFSISTLQKHTLPKNELITIIFNIQVKSYMNDNLKTCKYGFVSL